MKNRILLLSLLSSLLTSCVTMKTNTTKTMEIYGAGVIQNPVIVDLEVRETKVTGLAESKSESLSVIKNNAVANAMKNARADVFVEPKFETTTIGGNTTVTVTGFPATYKNFRPIKVDDLKLLEAGITQKAKTYEPIPPKKKKGLVIGIIMGTLILVGTLAGVGL